MISEWKGIQEGFEKKNKTLADRKEVFGKKSYQVLRGQHILPKVKYFYYLTPKILVAPRLFPHAEQSAEESKNVPGEEDISADLTSVAEYLNQNHKAAYIVYNLSELQSLSAGELLHQVMDYPFPVAEAKFEIKRH